MGTINHVPPRQQLENTPIPIYVEVAPNIRVGHAYLFYKGLGMPDFSRLEMGTVGAGYGARVPCPVFPPQVQYYIVVTDDTSAPVGFAGTPQQPLTVAVVTRRTEPPPAFPGRAPEATCSDECPPYMRSEECRRRRQQARADVEQRGARGFGDPCTSSIDCQAGLSCDGGTCTSSGNGGGTSGAGIGLWFSAGFGLALPYLNTGDSLQVYSDGTYGETIQIQNPGFAQPALQLRISGGYRIVPQFGIGVFGRISMAEILTGIVGARATFFILPQNPRIYLFASAGYGEIHPLQCSDTGKCGWGLAGYGAASLGGGFAFDFSEIVGLFAEIEVGYMFPPTDMSPGGLMNIDLTAGVQLNF